MSLQNKEVIRVGLESAYGDLSTTLETALVVGDVSYDPSAAARPQRNVNRPRGGNQAFLTGYQHASVGFSTELSAPLVDTDPAPWGILTQGCGIAQVTSGNKTVYNPILLNDKSLSLLVYKNANLHRIAGARGAASFNAKVGEQPLMQLAYQGRHHSFASEALPTTAPAQGKLQTVKPSEIVATLGGTALCIQSIEGNWGTAVAHSEDSCNEFRVVDHLPTVNLTITMPDFATTNLLESMQNETIGVLDVLWGASGFKTNVKAPKCSMGQIKYNKGAAGHTLTIPLSCLDDVGNDSLTLETGDLS